MKYKTTRVYHDVVNNIKRVNCLRGGTRSTKSFSLTQMAVRWLMYGKIGNLSIPSGDFFILRESFPALRRTVLKDFEMILSHEGFMPYVNHIKTTHEFKREKRTISFFSADDESKIHGPQNTIFWINEATAVPEKVFNQLIFRCSHFCFLDYNPNNPESYIKHRIENDRMLNDKDVSLDISTVYDNPFLTKAQFKEILKIKDQDLRKIYLQGAWAELSGLIFPNVELIDTLPIDFEAQRFGIDFGWVDPTTLIEVRKKDNNLYLHEHLYSPEVTNNKLADICHENINGSKAIADSASPLQIKELVNRGIRVRPAKKGPDSLLKGINTMKSYNLFVTKSSINLIKEFKTYKWQKDKEDNIIQKPIDDYNHGIDAARYAISDITKRKFAFL
jgi:phage terminase large subunit